MEDNNINEKSDLGTDSIGDNGEKKGLNLKLNLRIPFTKKQLLWFGLPILAVLLVIIGLWQQGFIADWFGGAYKASATVTVIGSDDKPLEGAVVIISSNTASTDANGQATIGDLRRGENEVNIRKSGYETYTKTHKLKRGANDLGSTKLTPLPLAKVDLTLVVKDYISDAVINDADILLTDVRPIYGTEKYDFTGVTVGNYQLKVSKSGYNTFETDITVDEKSTALDNVMLVKSGIIVFESNRDGGYSGIYTSNLDGTEQKQLVSRVGNYEDTNPLLGPNRRKVAFVSSRDGVRNTNGTDYNRYPYLVDVNGKNLVKISDKPDVSTLKWSPDGGFVGYTYYDETKNSSYVNIYDVIRKTTLSLDGYNNSYSYVFSADGNTVYFTGKSATDADSKLYKVSSSGGTPTVVDEHYASSLELTSSGTIRYSYYANNKTSYLEYNPANNTITSVEAIAVNEENEYYSAVLSPDKKKRAYVDSRDGKTNLFVSDPNGKNEMQITKLNSVVYEDLFWAEDGSYIVFTNKTNTESARYLTAIKEGATPKKIVDINYSYYYY